MNIIYSFVWKRQENMSDIVSVHWQQGKFQVPTMRELLYELAPSFERGPQNLKDSFRHSLVCSTS